jgi:hypothetical protein
MLNPEGLFDCLYIAAQLQDRLGNVAEVELHTFAYLACLLSLYRHRPVADWGYAFAGTKNGSPFSHDLSEAVQILRLAGCFRAEGNLLLLTERGKVERVELQELSDLSARLPFLEGACGSALCLPVGLIRHALLNEPTLRPSVKHDASRPLLEGPGTELLYEQFRTLSNLVGVKVDELMVPAVAWLSFLLRIEDVPRAAD